MARFNLYKQGPDNNSTYPGCWGSHATSPGRLVAGAETLVGLVAAATALGHSNWCVHDTASDEWVHPDDFVALTDGLVDHNGHTYRLGDLAHYMEYDQREAVHSSDAVPGTAQAFWDEFVRQFPADANHLITLVRPTNE